MSSEKMGPVGGNMGDAFTDGAFAGVKKITVGKDLECVSYIKTQYEKDGKFETREHGTIRGELKEFAVDYPSECIIAVGGSYGNVDLYKAVLIKSLFFKTSYGRTSPIFGETNSSGKEFMLEGKNGGKLLGFLGRSGQAIDAIGAYFSPVPEPEKQEAIGGNMGDVFDDGVFECVKKITVGKDLGCVSYIKIEYEKDGKFETREHGTIRGELKEFAVDYPKECVIAVGGSYDHVDLYKAVLIKSLFFKTSYGRTSPIFGEKNSSGKEFLLEGRNGGKLLGFHGRSGQAIDAIGAYFWPFPAPVPEKREAMGGNMGDAFDDGVFDSVKKIIVGKDLGCVSYIKIEYAKDGKTETREHGTIRGELKEFAVDYPNECITSVGGSYGHVNLYKAVLIESLFFKTSYGRTSPIFGSSGNVAGKEFLLEGKNGGKLLGLHGRSGQAIDAIGAYFWSVPAPEKIEAMGGNMGVAFDDGVFDGVKKIIVGKDLGCVSYIKIEYEKNKKIETREHGTIRGELKEFAVDYPYECITSVGGSYDHVDLYKAVLIKSLFFKTSYGRTSPIFGETNSSGKEFMLEGKNGGKLLGFLGRSGQAIDAIGAYFSPVPEPEKQEAIGGNMGDVFDDGVFECVKKITVGKDLGCVSYIKIEYEKDGKFETREHGTIRGELKEFAVDYPKECVIAVGGTYDHVDLYKAVLIKSLFFKTSYGRTSPIFGETNSSGKEFLLEGRNGGKLLGFHGRSGQAIDAIGAYFWPFPAPVPEKREAMGGNMGDAFDDGVFDSVKKIIVGKDLGCVSYIKIEYAKDGKTETREHRTIRGELKEFAVDYPNECITSVGGSYGHVNLYKAVLIESLFFKTSYGRTSPIFGSSGNVAGKEFLLEGKNGGKLLGLHGRSGQAIDAIGAYFWSVPAPEKIEAMGGNMGVAFDDGVFDGVKKIIVGKDLGCVSYIKIEYEKNKKIETREHGTIRGELKEFAVDYPYECITSVGGSYDHVDLYKAVLIKSLFFKTSYGRTSPIFGETNSSGNQLMLEGKNGGKLLGFHGRSGQAIDAIGAYFGCGNGGT
ncbi:Jacalin-like lectin domain [Arabidopsis thaliana x Arabidopsis arenosa]|uniref:Jacalin-like lectin domain n=1 Tax=Arabidopsis thaliana x Arabidopsis arenosa TaxID=1240361 RepID=A0A8T1Z0F7_9BRAS|nr:Jacalin-like lectin domain [Arabidopsis thaliana x Arabidopsis arenosa]